MKRKWIVETPGHVYDVEFAGSGLLATTENNLVIIDDTGNASVLYTHDAPIYKVRRWKDVLFLAAEDKRLVKLTPESLTSVEVEYGLFALDVKDGKVVAGGCCGAVYLIENDRVIKSITVGGHVYDVEWGPYIYVASFDGSLYAFDEELNLIKRIDLAENVNVVRHCGDRVAVGTFEPGGVFVLDKDLNLIWSRGNYLDVRMIAWREGCDGLYVGSWDGEFSLYTSGGKEVMKGRGPRGIESGAWSNGLLAVGGWGRIELYEEEGNELQESEEALEGDEE